jgi:hypothetical protein
MVWGLHKHQDAELNRSDKTVHMTWVWCFVGTTVKNMFHSIYSTSIQREEAQTSCVFFWSYTTLPNVAQWYVFAKCSKHVNSFVAHCTIQKGFSSYTAYTGHYISAVLTVRSLHEPWFLGWPHHMWLAQAMVFELTPQYIACVSLGFWADPTICGLREPWVLVCSHDMQLAQAMVFELNPQYIACMSLGFWADPTICGSREPWVLVCPQGMQLAQVMIFQLTSQYMACTVRLTSNLCRNSKDQTDAISTDQTGLISES